jgi:predicted RNA methylase
VGHVFPTEAAPKLAAMLGTGIAVDEKKRDQAFFTPRALADQVAARADVAGEHVLEPSAGNGALADACMRAGALSVSCFEINTQHMDTLRAKEYEVIWDDFLKFSPHKDALYSRIVMNPPFTKNQDIKHVLHALKWLAPGGILTAIMLDNQSRKGFEAIEVYDPGIETIPRGAFKEAGTDAPTMIVKIELD